MSSTFHRAGLVSAIVFALASCGTPAAAPGDPNAQGAQGGPPPEATIEVAPVAEAPTGAPSSEPSPPPASVPYRPMVAAGNVEECIAKLRSSIPPGDPPQRGGESDYNDGLSAERANDLPRAKKSYFNLIRANTDSDFIPAAYFAFGEMFAREAQQDPSKIPFAEQSYLEAIKYPAPGNALFAATLYRLGQVLVPKDPAKALSWLVKAAKADHDGVKHGCAVDIAAAALRASVPVFAAAGDPSRAFSFYVMVAGDGARAAQSALELAERYVTSSKGDDAATVLASSVEAGAKAQPDDAAKARYCKRATAASAAARAAATRPTASLDRAIGAACP